MHEAADGTFTLRAVLDNTVLAPRVDIAVTFPPQA
jgi:hypothetical protein